jgi:hypothetical protein
MIAGADSIDDLGVLRPGSLGSWRLVAYGLDE